MELLGSGSYGKVYLATKGDKKYAKKTMDFDELLSSNNLLEIDFACRLQHPNLIHAYFLEIADRTISLYFDVGTDLHNLLENNYISPISNYSSVLKILYDTAKALNYLHTFPIPCYHCDIKQPNIIVYGDITNPIAKLIDFSLAGTIHHSTPFGGTLGYSSPETHYSVTLGCERDLLKNDVWSFGVLMLVSLTNFYLVEFKNDDDQKNYSHKLIELITDNNTFEAKLASILLQSKHVVELYLSSIITDSELGQDALNIINKSKIKFNKDNKLDIINAAKKITSDKLKNIIRKNKLEILSNTQNFAPNYAYNLLKKIFVLDPARRISMREILDDDIWENCIDFSLLKNQFPIIDTEIINYVPDNSVIEIKFIKQFHELIKNINNSIHLKLWNCVITVQELIFTYNYFKNCYHKNKKRFDSYTYMLGCLYVSHILLNSPSSTMEIIDFSEAFEINENHLKEISADVILNMKGKLLECSLYYDTNITDILSNIIRKKLSDDNKIEHFTWSSEPLSNHIDKIIKKKSMIYMIPNIIFNGTIFNFTMRMILFEWMHELCQEFCYNNLEKLSQAYSFVDWITYYHGQHITRSDYQLIGLLCIVYAFDKTKFTNVSRLNFLTCNTYKVDHIITKYNWLSEILPYKYPIISLIQQALDIGLVKKDIFDEYNFIILFQIVNEQANINTLTKEFQDKSKYINNITVPAKFTNLVKLVSENKKKINVDSKKNFIKKSYV